MEWIIPKRHVEEKLVKLKRCEELIEALVAWLDIVEQDNNIHPELRRLIDELARATDV